MSSPVRAMNRTTRRRSVAVPWSLFPREFSVGQVLSLLWRGHGCRTWVVICASSPRGQMADLSMPIFFMWLRSLQWPVLYSRNIMVCYHNNVHFSILCWLTLRGHRRFWRRCRLTINVHLVNL